MASLKTSSSHKATLAQETHEWTAKLKPCNYNGVPTPKDFTCLLKAFTWSYKTSAAGGDVYFFGRWRKFFVWMSEIWIHSSSVGYAGEPCDLRRNHGRWWPQWLGWGTCVNSALCFNYSLPLGLLLRKITKNLSQGSRKFLGRLRDVDLFAFLCAPQWIYINTHT